jgi:hypothetical protein
MNVSRLILLNLLLAMNVHSLIASSKKPHINAKSLETKSAQLHKERKIIGAVISLTALAVAGVMYRYSGNTGAFKHMQSYFPPFRKRH